LETRILNNPQTRTIFAPVTLIQPAALLEVPALADSLDIKAILLYSIVEVFS